MPYQLPPCLYLFVLLVNCWFSYATLLFYGRGGKYIDLTGPLAKVNGNSPCLKIDRYNCFYMILFIIIIVVGR